MLFIEARLLDQLLASSVATLLILLLLLSCFSAKTREGVQDAFDELVHKVLQTPGLFSSDPPSQTVTAGANSERSSEQSWCGGNCSLS